MMRASLLLLFLLMPALATGQRVHGRVLDAATEQPVRSVELRLENAQGVVARAVADSAGRFLLRANTGAGRYRITTAHLGYAPTTSELELSTEIQLEVVLRLTAQPTELPPLVVVARSRAPDPHLERLGFYDRQAGRFGVFLGPEEIERKQPQSTSDLFRGISGVRVFYAGIRGNDLRMTRGEDPNCPPRMLLDGVVIRRGGRYRDHDTPIDVIIQPSALRAIEVYRSPSEVPQEYGGVDVTCGVVLLWTHRGAARR